MRILLRANGNVSKELKASNECVYCFSFKESSLTISYHAICVSTHINVVLPSQHFFGRNDKKRLMMMSHR